MLVWAMSELSKLMSELQKTQDMWTNIFKHFQEIYRIIYQHCYTILTFMWCIIKINMQKLFMLWYNWIVFWTFSTVNGINSKKPFKFSDSLRGFCCSVIIFLSQILALCVLLQSQGLFPHFRPLHYYRKYWFSFSGLPILQTLQFL